MNEPPRVSSEKVRGMPAVDPARMERRVEELLRGYPETVVGKRVDLFDSERISYQHRSARLWFIEHGIERNILPI
jgi:hypothetical protein